MAPDQANSEAMPEMDNVFKQHPQPEVMQDMKSFYRVLARTHLQQTIPGKITHLRVLLDSGSDASSVLWPGHTATEAFNKVTFFQPADPEIAKLGLKVTMPDQVVGPSDEISDEENDEPSETTDAENGDAKKGSKVGARWFDVFPQNEVQDKLVKMSVKETEDTNIICQDLRTWLELEVPVIEDGNSFGAEVQGHMIKELNEACKRSNAFNHGCRQHYVHRLKLAVDWVRYPNLMDFPAAITASDRFDHFLYRSYLRTLLIIFSGILNKFERNWEKVIKPKGSGSSGGMY